MTVGRDPNAVSTGAGTIYLAPLSTTEPTALSGAMPIGWVDLGYTEAGVTFTVQLTSADVNVDEEFFPVRTTVTGKSGKVDFSLSQMTAENLYVANAGGTITTSGGIVTFTPPAAGTEARVMLSWRAAAGDEQYVWRRCFQTGSSATKRSKALPQALIPVSFNVEKPAGAEPWSWYALAARSGQ